MSDRELMADELAGWPIGQGYYGTSIGIDDAQALAASLIDSGWRKLRTITTTEELDALPDGSVVATRYGDAINLHRSAIPNAEEFHFTLWNGPATVLREGPAPEAVAS